MPNLVEYEPAVIGTPSSFTVTFTNNNDPKNSFVKTVFLHGLIEPELLQFKVYPTKLEVQMRKKTSGNWPSLEKGFPTPLLRPLLLPQQKIGPRFRLKTTQMTI